VLVLAWSLTRKPTDREQTAAASGPTWRPQIQVSYSDRGVARGGEQLAARRLADRVAAARALASLGPRAAEAVPALLHALSKPSCEIEMQAACQKALKAIGPAATPELVAALRSGQPKMRFQAAMAIVKLGPLARDAVGPLTGALENDPDYSVRTAAATALGAIGPAASPALGALKRAAGNPNQKLTHDPQRAELRVRAWSALREIREGKSN